MDELMHRSLEMDFEVPVRWLEEKVATTMGNARRSARLLQRDGIDSVYLMTHRWHMRRALYVFKKIGLKFVLYGADRVRNWMYPWN